MRSAAILIVLTGMIAGHAQAQAIMMPSNADMRAMQPPSDWEGSRAEGVQGKEAPAVTAAPQIASGPVAAATTSTDPRRADFAVEVWDDHNHLVETMAHCSDLLVGKAAFREAAKERSGRKVTLRHGSDYIVIRNPGELASR